MKAIAKIAAAKPSVLSSVINAKFVLRIHRFKGIERMRQCRSVDHTRLRYLNGLSVTIIILCLKVLQAVHIITH